MIRNVFSLTVTLTSIGLLMLTACEEDLETPTDSSEDSTTAAVVIAPPTLTAQSTSIATLIKFGVEVEINQVQDTAYYVVLTADADALSAEALMNRADTTALPMKGNRMRTGFQSDLSEDTDYVVYAVLKQGKHLSEVASLAMTADTNE